MDAIVEIAVDAIASKYPKGELIHATCHESGKITGQFVDPKLGQIYNFRIGNGFTCSPTIFCKITVGNKEIQLNPDLTPIKPNQPLGSLSCQTRFVEILANMFIFLAEAMIWLGEVLFFEFKQSAQWVFYGIPPEGEKQSDIFDN